MSLYQIRMDKYSISKNRVLELRHFGYQYPEWLCDTARHMEKIRMVEMAVITVSENAPGLHDYLLEHVTNKDMTVERLLAKGMPCGRDKFREMRRRFYYLLDKARG